VKEILPKLETKMKIEWIEKYLVQAEKMMLDDRLDDGLAVLENLLYEEPGYSSLHNHLGWAYLYYTENVSRAELHLKMAIKFDEAQAAPYVHLGALYIRQAKYNDAITCMQTALTKVKDNQVGLLQTLAQAYELSKDWNQAIKAYKKAMIVSVVSYESEIIMTSIKRCRKKRMALLFGL
jgi:tetratricopeptide (TPR) repeat protein